MDHAEEEEEEEKWFLLWVQERSFKVENFRRVRSLRESLREHGGDVNCFKKAKKLSAWLEQSAEPPAYVLLTDWREAKLCMEEITGAGNRKHPVCTIVMCSSRKQLQHVATWASNVRPQTDFPIVACLQDNVPRRLLGGILRAHFSEFGNSGLGPAPEGHRHEDAPEAPADAARFGDATPARSSHERWTPSHSGASSSMLETDDQSATAVAEETNPTNFDSSSATASSAFSTGSSSQEIAQSTVGSFPATAGSARSTGLSSQDETNRANSDDVLEPAAYKTMQLVLQNLQRVLKGLPQLVEDCQQSLEPNSAMERQQPTGVSECHRHADHQGSSERSRPTEQAAAAAVRVGAGSLAQGLRDFGTPSAPFERLGTPVKLTRRVDGELSCVSLV